MLWFPAYWNRFPTDAPDDATDLAPTDSPQGKGAIEAIRPERWIIYPRLAMEGMGRTTMALRLAQLFQSDSCAIHSYSLQRFDCRSPVAVPTMNETVCVRH